VCWFVTGKPDHLGHSKSHQYGTHRKGNVWNIYPKVTHMELAENVMPGILSGRSYRILHTSI
jgi:hypothetical protein